jgi:hypothetical protein
MSKFTILALHCIFDFAPFNSPSISSLVERELYLNEERENERISIDKIMRRPSNKLFLDESTFSHAGRRERKSFFHAEMTFFHTRATFFHARASFSHARASFFHARITFFMVLRLFNWRLRDRGIYSLRVLLCCSFAKTT